MKGILSILISILLIHNYSSAQCTYSDLDIAPIDCIDQVSFEVTIDFEQVQPSATGYLITANTVNLGIVQYEDLPVTIGALDGNCITEYFFTIVNLSDNTCDTTQSIGVVCCDIPCEIKVEDFVATCVNDEINIVTDLSLTGLDTDSIDISTNEEYVGRYAAEDILDNGFIVPTISPVQSVHLCEQGTNCCDTIFVDNPCVCNIYDVELSIVDCDDESDEYYLRVDFDTTLITSDSFNIGLPGNNLGIHAYADIPVLVGPVHFEDEDGEIFILDSTDPFCFGFAEHMILDSCAAVVCSFSDLNIESISTCNDGMVWITFSFYTTVESSGFTAKVEGNSSQTYAYGLKSYQYGPISADCIQGLMFSVQDLEDSDCSTSVALDPVCCECQFTNVEVVPICTEGLIDSINIGLVPNGDLSDTLLFAIDEGEVTFRLAYNDLPTTVDIEDINSIANWMITDIYNEICSVNGTIENECNMACEILLFEVSELLCNPQDSVIGSFILEANNINSQDSFRILYNGTTLSTYEYGDGGDYLFTPFSLECEIDFQQITIEFIEDLNCTASVLLNQLPCCEDCTIENTMIGAICQDDLEVHLTVDFDYNGNLTDSIDVFIADVITQRIAISELPYTFSIGAFAEGIYNYEIIGTNCISEGEFTINCTEECIIENIAIDTVSCEEGEFYSLLNFDHTQGLDSFTLIIDGIEIGDFHLDSLPVHIGPLSGNGETSYLLHIIIHNTDNCEAEYLTQPVDCEMTAVDEIPEYPMYVVLPAGIHFTPNHTIDQASLVDMQGRVRRSMDSSSRFLDLDQMETGIYILSYSIADHWYHAKVYLP